MIKGSFGCLFFVLEFSSFFLFSIIEVYKETRRILLWEEEEADLAEARSAQAGAAVSPATDLRQAALTAAAGAAHRAHHHTIPAPGQGQ